MPRTLLGFDFGRLRIGVAVGNTLTGSARALTIVDADPLEQRWQAIAALIDEWRPDALVVGRPVLHGQPGAEERQRQRDQRRRPHDPRVVLPGDEEPGGEEGERVARAQRPPPHDDERDAAGPVLDERGRDERRGQAGGQQQGGAGLELLAPRDEGQHRGAEEQRAEDVDDEPVERQPVGHLRDRAPQQQRREVAPRVDPAARDVVGQQEREERPRDTAHPAQRQRGVGGQEHGAPVASAPQRWAPWWPVVRSRRGPRRGLPATGCTTAA